MHQIIETTDSANGRLGENCQRKNWGFAPPVVSNVRRVRTCEALSEEPSRQTAIPALRTHAADANSGTVLLIVLGRFAADGVKEKECDRIAKVLNTERGSGRTKHIVQTQGQVQGAFRAVTILLGGSRERIRTAAAFPLLRVLYQSVEQRYQEETVIIQVGDCTQSSHLYHCQKISRSTPVCSAPPSRKLSDVYLEISSSGMSLSLYKRCLSRVPLIW